MKFKAKTTKLFKAEADVLVVFVDSDNWKKQIATFDDLLDRQLLKYAQAEGFKGDASQLFAYPTAGKLASPLLLLLGLGKPGELELNDLRLAAARAAKYAYTTKRRSVAFDLTSDIEVNASLEAQAKAVVEGVALGAYRFHKYKTQDKDQVELEEVTLVTSAGRLQHIVNGLTAGEFYAAGTLFARDLVNESPTVTTPTFLANVAKNLGKWGEIAVEILNKKEIAKLGMNAYLAVNQGSNEAPKFIKLTYKNGKKKIVIAGKCITFDTGGLNLKDYKNMETMKLDMAGGAAVLGLFSILPKLKPKATVVGLIAATENMPGPGAMKQGDIVRALNGKTIEILHTDAEGRLTLADMLSYAVMEKPDAIIDLATLTGACMVALGEEISGLFSNNQELTKQLQKASTEAGEKLWQLPLEKNYRDLVKSDIADLQNTGKTRYGGAITAALFLEEFVDKIPWAHLDIAGPAFEERGNPLTPKGATGFGVRTLLNYLKNL